MTFLIISHVLHRVTEGRYFAYSPYIREMNLWMKYTDKVIIVAPLSYTDKPGAIDQQYDHPDITFIEIPQFDIQGTKSIIRTIFLLPLLANRITKGMRMADHIHLRCPGNVGLIGCFIQIFFPRKKKTAKYASNWDPASPQPRSYRLQEWLLRNTLLTRNMTVLVYGNWSDRTKNIKPFFTASYSENDKQTVSKRLLNDVINIAFVGTLTENKSPLMCLEVLRMISCRGINATLTYCGDGPERTDIEVKVKEYNLNERTRLLGNVDAQKVKEVLRESHFLVFISRSEGWPKAVSEAMWWGCLPITTPVSCVPQMLGNGERGHLVNENVQQICDIIVSYVSDQVGYNEKCQRAINWSIQYTLERFENEIRQLLQK